jgi:hypothetical protein
MNETMKKWVALVVILTSALSASAALGAGYDPCYEAYLESGLTKQQMSFDHFRHSYSDTLCSPEGHDLQAAREGRGVGETR